MKTGNYLLAIAMLCLAGACNNDHTDCNTRAADLNAKEQALNQREEQLNAREKQLQGNDTGTTTGATAGSITAGSMAGKEPSLYRRNRTRTGYPHSNTAGQFPEGSDRLLTDRDLEYLSPWGIKVITNEIYARHGMRFTDPELKRHFDEEQWYRPRTNSVNGSLSKTEKQNLNFIADYKAAE